MESATRASAFSHDWMSSAVTQVGKLPRKTVKLIRWGVSLTGDLTKIIARLQSSGSFYGTTKCFPLQRIHEVSRNFFIRLICVTWWRLLAQYFCCKSSVADDKRH
jgi:hypothetical protein